MDYNLSYPNITYRKRIVPSTLHRGSIVAFRIWERNVPRTGIIVMESSDWMLLAVNLCEEEGRIWWSDGLPEQIELYEATEEEILWGLRRFLEYYSESEESQSRHPIIAFIDQECPKNDNNSWGEIVLCQNMLSHVPELLDKNEWDKLKQQVSSEIRNMTGLQYDRYRTEYYCFLMGVLMIAEHEQDESKRKELIQLFKANWWQFSWMYGIGIGRVIGSRLHNFTAVINQTGQNKRQHYLHLYLSLADHSVDRICTFNDDKRDRLQAAINKMKVVEAREKQETDLDELFGIIFPRYFVDAMASSRPAATFAELQQELIAQQHKISDLENKLSVSIADFNQRYDALLSDFEALASASLTFDELKEGLKKLPTQLALDILQRLTTPLSENTKFMAEHKNLVNFVLEKEKQNSKPNEIHNHFATGSGCQVFNGRVSGQFDKK